MNDIDIDRKDGTKKLKFLKKIFVSTFSLSPENVFICTLNVQTRRLQILKFISPIYALCAY